MGAFPPGTIGVMSCQGDPHLEVAHFFQKSLRLGEASSYFQAFRLEQHLDGGYKVSFWDIYASALPVRPVASRDRDGIKEHPFLRLRLAAIYSVSSF